jgi:electron transport complex protein RnfB
MTAVVIIGVLALIAGLALSYANRSLPARASGLVDQLNDMLPQTQCAQCGYPGCRPYARAIVDDGAAINLCPPGGEATVRQLAALLGKDALPLAEPAAGPPGVAVIDEARCIGCGHCRNACPVDAIVGAHHLMYSIIKQECTGCELCIAPCPVDCISMQVGQ